MDEIMEPDRIEEYIEESMDKRVFPTVAHLRMYGYCRLFFDIVSKNERLTPPDIAARLEIIEYVMN